MSRKDVSQVEEETVQNKALPRILADNEQAAKSIELKCFVYSQSQYKDEIIFHGRNVDI